MCFRNNGRGCDGSARLRTKTRLATKSTTKLELADTQYLPGRLDGFGKFEFSEFPGFPTDLASAKDSRTENPSCVLIKCLDGASASGDAEIVMSAFQEVQRIPMGALPDIVVLHRTLVADGGLPSGYEKEFSTFGPVLETAAQRQDRRFCELSNMEASILLKQYKAQGEMRAKDAKTSADQFLPAAEMPPRRYMSRLQRSLYAGPTAWKGAEGKERARPCWFTHLLPWEKCLGTSLVASISEGLTDGHPRCVQGFVQFDDT